MRLLKLPPRAFESVDFRWLFTQPETPEHVLKVIPPQKAHVIADSARLAANPQSQVGFTLGGPTFTYKGDTFLLRPSVVQDFPDWIITCKSKAGIESEVFYINTQPSIKISRKKTFITSVISIAN